MKKSNPILLTGQHTLDSGKTLYLGFEEITSGNKDYWLNYYTGLHHHAITIVANFFYSRRVVHSIPNAENDRRAFDTFLNLMINRPNEFENKHRLAFKFNRDQTDIEKMKKSFIEIYEKFEKHLDQFDPYHTDTTKIIEKLKYHLDKLNGGRVTKLITDEIQDGEYAFMVYGSTQPITQETIQTHLDYNKDDPDITKFRNIVISAPFKTHKDSPTYTHYGLIKNSWHIIDPRNYSYATLALKGFSAHCCDILKDTIGEKTFFTTNPLESLVDLLNSTLGKIHIHAVTPELRPYIFANNSGYAQRNFNSEQEKRHELYKERFIQGNRDILRKGSILDPFTKKSIPLLGSLLTYAKNFDTNPDIIIEKACFLPFYDGSSAIKNPRLMMHFLEELESCDESISPELLKRIEKAYPEVKAFKSTGVDLLDDLYGFYDALIPSETILLTTSKNPLTSMSFFANTSTETTPQNSSKESSREKKTSPPSTKRM